MSISTKVTWEKNLKVRENSLIFEIFTYFHVIKVEIEKNEMLRVRPTILPKLAKNRFVLSQNPARYLAPVFRNSKKSYSREIYRIEVFGRKMTFLKLKTSLRNLIFVKSLKSEIRLALVLPFPVAVHLARVRFLVPVLCLPVRTSECPIHLFQTIR